VNLVRISSSSSICLRVRFSVWRSSSVLQTPGDFSARGEKIRFFTVICSLMKWKWNNFFYIFSFDDKKEWSEKSQFVFPFAIENDKIVFSRYQLLISVRRSSWSNSVDTDWAEFFFFETHTHSFLSFWWLKQMVMSEKKSVCVICQKKRSTFSCVMDAYKESVWHIDKNINNYWMDI
jgi:hypothetical protein